MHWGVGIICNKRRRIVMEEYKYTIVGYNKLSKSYVKYAEMTSFEDAVSEAKHLGVSIRKGELTKLCGMNIDWVEIYEDWEKPDKKSIWGSYDLSVVGCANV